MTTETEQIEEGPRSFAAFIQQTGGHGELSGELHELMCALAEYAAHTQQPAKGELNIKLRFKVEPNGVVAIGYEVKRKDPIPGRPTTIMWLTPGGNLTPRNPRQQVLPLHEVTVEREQREVTPAREVRDV